MTMNVLALSIIQGLCAALDTLCSQAYASPNPKNTSLHALRTAFLTAVVLAPMSVLIYNGERLLLGLKQDPEVSKLAGQYLRGDSGYKSASFTDLMESQQSYFSAYLDMLDSRSQDVSRRFLLAFAACLSGNRLAASARLNDSTDNQPTDSVPYQYIPQLVTSMGS